MGSRGTFLIPLFNHIFPQATRLLYSQRAAPGGRMGFSEFLSSSALRHAGVALFILRPTCRVSPEIPRPICQARRG